MSERNVIEAFRKRCQLCTAAVPLLKTENNFQKIIKDFFFVFLLSVMGKQKIMNQNRFFRNIEYFIRLSVVENIQYSQNIQCLN